MKPSLINCVGGMFISYLAVWIFIDFGGNGKAFEWYGSDGMTSSLFILGLLICICISTDFYLDEKKINAK